ncbi:hypothetical protein [Palleronia caenipelagi]|uniref:Mor transcription activator domain-containing protein n=1 Tax=Palleronia caenipelagi TaxID=2489174 RepID=A0A547Q840_9RHOB|nr:hypothetical protein [Palleronia caenipelagi]TRD22545.1 hypothetical protein FEV53_03780 [Palleronia caenipelagi]
MSSSNCITEHLIALRQQQGPDAERLLMENFAGGRHYIPRRESAKFERLCDLIGEPAATYLADCCGGFEWDFPSQRTYDLRKHRAAILSDLRNPDLTLNDVALRNGISRRWASILRQRGNVYPPKQDP